MLEYNLRCAICRAILLAFKKNLKYDYCIPRGNHIRERLQSKLPSINVTPSLKQKIEEVISLDWVSDSELENFMNRNQPIFRSEWFYQWGELYTWRRGERKKSMAMMKEYLSPEEIEDMKIVWEVLKIQNLRYDKKPIFWFD